MGRVKANLLSQKLSNDEGLGGVLVEIGSLVGQVYGDYVSQRFEDISFVIQTGGDGFPPLSTSPICRRNRELLGLHFDQESKHLPYSFFFSLANV
jgi:hypothetical protein